MMMMMMTILSLHNQKKRYRKCKKNIDMVVNNVLLEQFKNSSVGAGKVVCMVAH